MTRLTTVDRVKQLLFSGTDTDPGADYDELLDLLVAEVSDLMEKRMGRTIAEATYTEYYDGTGTDTLLLKQGPLVSVTSVETVEYSDAGSGVRQETLTAVDQADRLEGGLRSEGASGVGSIRLISGAFTRGRRNYKVVYVAGWEDDTEDPDEVTTIPQALVRVATSHAAALFNLRDLAGLAGRDVGDGSVSTIPAANLDDALERGIAPFEVRSIA